MNWVREARRRPKEERPLFLRVGKKRKWRSTFFCEQWIAHTSDRDCRASVIVSWHVIHSALRGEHCRLDKWSANWKKSWDAADRVKRNLWFLWTSPVALIFFWAYGSCPGHDQKKMGRTKRWPDTARMNTCVSLALSARTRRGHFLEHTRRIFDPASLAIKSCVRLFSIVRK